MSNTNVELQALPTVDVLLAVDVEGALSTDNLSKNIWMVDTTGYAGGGNQGTNALVTAVGNGQKIVWSVAPINPGTNAAIVSFAGQAITGKNINPQKTQSDWDSPWQASTFIPLATRGTKYQYTMTLQFGGANGKKLTFDPYLLSTT